METIQSLPAWFVYASTFAFSLLVGSFLNVVIYRFPIMMMADFKQQARDILQLPQEKVTEAFNLVVPRSRCRGCNRLITAKDNIPVLSYLLIKGKCRQCHEPISIFYPIVEALTAVLSILALMQFGINYQGFYALILVFFLVALSGIDLKTQLLPDSMTLSLLWIGLMLAAVAPDYYIPLKQAVLGAVIAYALFWSIATGFYLITKREGMGLGDAKLVAALCAWISIYYFPILILIACFSGLLATAIAKIFAKRPMFKNPIPFGPHLALGGFITFLYGEAIMDWYLNLFLSSY